MKKILFVTNDQGSWIDQDEKILQSHFKVTRRHIDKNYYLHFLQFFLDVLHQDLIYAWFGSFTAFPVFLMARILGKKVIIVSGGFDVARLDEFDHGGFAKNEKLSFLRRILFQLPNKVFCVSASNRQEALQNAGIPQKKAVLIYLGFKDLLGTLPMTPWDQRQNQVISISSFDRKYFKIKGIDQLIEVATLLPEINFIHLGKIAEDIKDEVLKKSPQNLKFKGFVPFQSEEFLNVLSQSKIILQLSAYESFCSAVVEGALCGCFPIVSDRFGLNELVKTFGQSVSYGQPVLAVQQILSILNSKQDSAVISKVFLDKYSLDARKESLIREIEAIF